MTPDAEHYVGFDWKALTKPRDAPYATEKDRGMDPRYTYVNPDTYGPSLSLAAQ
jgi:hypothetical protein